MRQAVYLGNVYFGPGYGGPTTGTESVYMLDLATNTVSTVASTACKTDTRNHMYHM